MDEITRDIQGEISWCMLFADDVVLVDENSAHKKYNIQKDSQHMGIIKLRF